MQSVKCTSQHLFAYECGNFDGTPVFPIFLAAKAGEKTQQRLALLKNYVLYFLKYKTLFHYKQGYYLITKGALGNFVKKVVVMTLNWQN